MRQQHTIMVVIACGAAISIINYAFTLCAIVPLKYYVFHKQLKTNTCENNDIQQKKNAVIEYFIVGAL